MNSYAQPVGAIEKIYALIALSLVVGIFTPLFSSRAASTIAGQIHQGSMKFQLISGAIYLISAALLIAHQGRVIEIIKNNVFLSLFVVLILFSSIWAELPDVSLRRSLALFGTTILGIYLAVRFPPNELLDLLGKVLMLLVLESLFLALFVPEVGVHAGFGWVAGAWRGALEFKNDFGRTMVLSTILFWILSHRAGQHRSVYLGFCSLSIILVIMSQSRSAWVISMILVIFIPVLIYLQKGGRDLILRALIVIVLSSTIVMMFVLPNLEQLLALINRDITLTGRTHVWLSAIDIGLERPWLGHGYRSFWIESVSGFIIIAGHGHNSFLDLWVELGFVGLVLFVITLVIAFYQALKQMRHSSEIIALWHPMFLIFLLMYGTVGKVFPEHSTIIWVLYIVTHVYLSSSSVAIRAQNVPAVLKSG